MSEQLCGAQCHHEEKKLWTSGPWSREPDRVDFRHAGFACLLHRSHMGMWCGYVGLPPGHPLHGKQYDAVEVEVHGGLTYSAKCSPPICHVPEPGEPEDLWWLGFDCAHLFDLVPGLRHFEHVRGMDPVHNERYRSLRYARYETEKLAEQLAAKN